MAFQIFSETPAQIDENNRKKLLSIPQEDSAKEMTHHGVRVETLSRRTEAGVPLVLLGGGGHARSVLGAIHSWPGRFQVLGFCDDHLEVNLDASIPHLGSVETYLSGAVLTGVKYICCVGDNKSRQNVVKRLEDGLQKMGAIYDPSVWCTLVDARASVSSTVELGRGTVVLMNAILQTHVVAGSHCIFNTGCSVDHDCEIADFVHIAPRSTLCGTVRCHAFSLIGAHSTVLPRHIVPTGVCVRAGSLAFTKLSVGQSVSNRTRTVSETLSRQQQSDKGSFSNWVPDKAGFALPYLHQELEESINLNQFTNGGPAVCKLERMACDLLGVRQPEKVCIAVNNGTSALHALVAAIHLEKGRTLKWATQAFTFPASAQGPLAEALLVDIDDGGGLDPSDPRLLGHDVDGLIVTNCFGCLVNRERYETWCSKHDKILIFDNAATSQSGDSINWGQAATISLHHTKPLGFGEGGLIVVDAKYAHAIRRIINFGYDVVKADYIWLPNGSNFKMSDVAAAWILAFWRSGASQITKSTHTKAWLAVCTALEQTSARDRCCLFPHWDGNGTQTCVPSCIPLLCAFDIHDETLQHISTRHQICLRKYYRPLAVGFSTSQKFYDHIVCIPCHVEVPIAKVLAVLNDLLKNVVRID